MTTKRILKPECYACLKHDYENVVQGQSNQRLECCKNISNTACNSCMLAEFSEPTPFGHCGFDKSTSRNNLRAFIQDAVWQAAKYASLRMDDLVAKRLQVPESDNSIQSLKSSAKLAYARFQDIELPWTQEDLGSHLQDTVTMVDETSLTFPSVEYRILAGEIRLLLTELRMYLDMLKPYENSRQTIWEIESTAQGADDQFNYIARSRSEHFDDLYRYNESIHRSMLATKERLSARRVSKLCSQSNSRQVADAV